MTDGIAARTEKEARVVWEGRAPPGGGGGGGGGEGAGGGEGRGLTMATSAAVVVMSGRLLMGIHLAMLMSGRPPSTCPTTRMPLAARPKPQTTLIAKLVTVSGPRGRIHLHLLHAHGPTSINALHSQAVKSSPPHCVHVSRPHSCRVLHNEPLGFGSTGAHPMLHCLCISAEEWSLTG